MPKKNLQIQTNFLDGDDQFQIQAIRQEKAAIVQFMEKKLSCILARNFIQCWEQMKEYRFKQKKSQIQQLNHLSQNYMRPNSSSHKIKTQGVQQRMHSRNSSREKKHRVRTVHYVDSPHADYRKYRTKSHRRHSQAGEERANVLEEIVQKLKASHQRNDFSGQIGVEVLRKVSRLERMMQNIKTVNHSSNVLVKEVQTRQNKDLDQDQTVRMFVDEIRDIRKQLAGIKHTNEEFIKAQLQAEINRSRTSQKDYVNLQNFQISNPPKIYNPSPEKTFIQGLSQLHKTQKISPKNYPQIFKGGYFENRNNTASQFTRDIPKINIQPSPSYEPSSYQNNLRTPSNPNIRIGSNNDTIGMGTNFSYLNTQYKPSSNFNFNTPSYNKNGYNFSHDATGGFKYNSGGNISTSTTFTSFPTSQTPYKPMFSDQFNHNRNPSIQIRYEQSNKPKPWELQGYCSSCGRSCGCQRSFRPASRQHRYF